MNSPARCESAGHHHHREALTGDHAAKCLLTDSAGRDFIDTALADPRADFPPSCRSKVDADRLLSILDELAGGEG